GKIARGGDQIPQDVPLILNPVELGGGMVQRAFGVKRTAHERWPWVKIWGSYSHHSGALRALRRDHLAESSTWATSLKGRAYFVCGYWITGRSFAQLFRTYGNCFGFVLVLQLA
ncbi:unnamed protein product, partial [Rhizoctonia solani]